MAAMFDDVAPKYDIVNDILSMGQTRRWRRVVVDAVDAKPGQRVLDLAAGTGTSSEPYADAGVNVVACDFSVGMLKVGKRRRPDIDFIAGDATNLPFAEDSFDASTISFASSPHAVHLGYALFLVSISTSTPLTSLSRLKSSAWLDHLYSCLNSK